MAASADFTAIADFTALPYSCLLPFPFRVEASGTNSAEMEIAMSSLAGYPEHTSAADPSAPAAAEYWVRGTAADLEAGTSVASAADLEAGTSVASAADLAVATAEALV